jgi:hypothetical protein
MDTRQSRKYRVTPEPMVWLPVQGANPGFSLGAKGLYFK